MRERLLIAIARLAHRRPWWVLGAALIFTVIAGDLASKLELTMRWSDMLPEKHLMTVEFNRIIEQYSSASTIVIVAEGEEDDLKKYADEVAPKIEALTEYVQRVDYMTDVDFFKNHALMTMKTSDLKNTWETFTDANLVGFLRNLNDGFEKEYISDDDALSTLEKENQAVLFLDGIGNWLGEMKEFGSGGGANEDAVAAVDRLFFGEKYYMSQDKKMLIMIVRPTFSVMDMEKVLAAVDDVELVAKGTAEKFDGIVVGMTGMLTLSRDEYAASMADMMLTSWISILAIITLFIITFRMWAAPLLAGFVLIIGVTWAMGLSYLLVGSLNMMTSMTGVILLGLGIDFSIHIISGFSELRSWGVVKEEAIESTLRKSGIGVITGGLTTSAAFLTLMISETRGMSELGLVTGIGIIACLVSTLVVLPSLLILRERYRERRGKGELETRDISFRFLGRQAKTLARNWKLSIPGTVGLTAVFVWFMMNIDFDTNYLNMEPKGLESVEYQYKMLDKLDLSTDFGMVSTPDIERAREIAKEARELGIVGMVESMSDFVTDPVESEARAAILRRLKEKLDGNSVDRAIDSKNLGSFREELARLEYNLMELSDMAYLGGQEKVDKKAKSIVGDPEDDSSTNVIAELLRDAESSQDRFTEGMNRFQDAYRGYFRQAARSMANEEPVELGDLPVDIKDRFISKDGNEYLVTIYPSEQVWDIEYMERFSRQLWEIEPRTTGTPPTFLAMFDAVGTDGKRAAFMAVGIVFLILLADFRSLKYAVLAMVPLIIGFSWMLGIMSLIDMPLTLVNVMGLPLILGIGIDDGVHILHRYKREGAGSVELVFSTTGKAVLLTSLTTMLAFGSLLFATYRGFGSLGGALAVGVGACFLATVLILPGLFGMLEREKRS